MADFFISYSRKDVELVKRLASALEKLGRVPWVDWDDIRPAENFMDAIYGAIEQAQTFVFVISPDSVHSVVCGRELGHALKHNKRLIPLVSRDVEAENVPPALAMLDWVFVREVDNFEFAVSRLMSALETDLAWVRMHTRLLVRAKEWQEKGRNDSFLLSGDDLRDAERTVAQSTRKQPMLTDLQQEYVLASHLRTTRVQRYRLAAVTTALVISIGLAILAFWQYQLADRRSRIATAQRLAAEAGRVQNESPQLSLLLGVEAQHVTQRENEPPVTAATTALLHSLSAFSGFPLLGHTSQIRKVRFTTAGKWLISSSSDSIRLWRIGTKEIATSIALFGQDEWPLDVSPDGQWLATADTTGVSLWDLTAPEPQKRVVKVPVGRVSEIAFSPNGRWIACTNANGVYVNKVTEALEGKVNLTALEDTIGVRSISFSGEKGDLIIAHGNGTVRSWNLESTALSGSVLGHAEGGGEIAVSPDGRFILISVHSGPSLLLDQTMLHRAILLHLSEWGVRAIFSPDGRWLATIMRGSEEEVQLFDLSQWKGELLKPTALVGHIANVVTMVFSPDSQWLITGSEDATARAWRIGLTTNSYCPVVLRGHDKGIFSVAISSDGRHVATGGRDDTVRIWDLQSRDPVADARVLHGLESVWKGPQFGVDLVAFSPDGNWLVGRGYESKLRIWRVLGRGSWSLPLFAFDNADKDLDHFASEHWTVTKIEGNRASIRVNVLDRASSPQMGLSRDEKSPDGKWLLARKQGYSELRTLLHPKQVLRLPIDAYATARFSDNGRWLAANPLSRDMWVWDLTSQESPPRKLTGHTQPINNFAFSRDGKRLATLSADALLLWDLDSGEMQPIRLEMGAISRVSAVGFSADGKFVAVEVGTGSGYLWPLEPHDLIGLVHQVVGRKFTNTEWEEYFGTKPYQRTFEDISLPNDAGRSARR